MGIIRRIFKKKEPTPQLGGKIYKPSEVAEQTGGFVSVTDPRIPEVYQGTPQQIQASRAGGGAYIEPPKTASSIIKKGGGGATTLGYQGGASTIASQLASKTISKLDTSIAQGRKSQADVYMKAGLDKFGRTQSYYDRIQREMKLKKAEKQQTKVYQKLYDKGQMEFEQANIGLQNVLNVYSKDLYKQDLEKERERVYKIDMLQGSLTGSQVQYGGTRMDMGLGMPSDAKQHFETFGVMKPGTIYSTTTGETFKGEPVFKTSVIGEDWSSRTATREEQLILDPMTETIGTGRKTKVGQLWGETTGEIKEFGGEEWGAGVYAEKKIEAWSFKGGKARQITGGIVSGIIPTSKGELIKTGVSFGIGAGIGAGVKGGSLLLGSIPKAGKYVAPAFKLGAYGGGTYLTGAYALSVAGRVSGEEDYYAKGEILGESGREFGALGLGYGVGAKGTEMLYGLYRVRGRAEIPLERITRKEVISGKESFPTAPKETHIKLFKGTVEKIPELTEGKAGGFHVTPEQFWKGKKLTGEIIPKAGTSELPGLYVGSEASIYFSGLKGKGYSPFSLPTLKSILSGEKPAIAFLKPEGFREVGFKKVSPYEIGGQQFKFAFKEPARKGFIDIPKMKTEIEGVARIEAGKYGYESGKYYTTIQGVKVPIDVFGFKKGKIDIGIKEVKGVKGFVSEEYGYLPKKIKLSDIRSSLYSKRFGSYYKGYSKIASSYFRPSSYKTYGTSNIISSYLNRPLSISPYSPKSRERYLKSSLIYTPKSPYSMLPYYPRRPPIKPPLYLPKKIGMKQKPKAKRKLTEQERYSPSFTASLLKIKSSRDILGDPLKGGFRIRGIIQ